MAGDEMKEEKAYCRECAGERRHDVLFSHEIEHDYNPEDFAFFEDTWAMLSCRGCDTVAVRRRLATDHHYNFNAEELEPDISIYPPAPPDHAISVPDYDLPPRLRRLHREVIDAFNEEIVTLCAAGLRGLIEGACLEKGVKKGPVPLFDDAGNPKVDASGKQETKIKKNLEGKIAGLVVAGVLGSEGAAHLHELRFLGNEAVHELAAPSLQELKLAIDIIHPVLDAVFGQHTRVESLKALKAIRKKKTKP